MSDNNCIFCKIANGEIPSAKFWEDENFLAILDINPNTHGMALVLTKKHFNSYAFDMPEKEYEKFFTAAKKVAKTLEKGLNVQRIAMVMEGMGVNHAHIKLYPLHGLNEKFKEILANERVYFDKYLGYVSTQLGPQADIEELKRLAEKLKRDSK